MKEKKSILLATNDVDLQSCVSSLLPLNEYQILTLENSKEVLLAIMDKKIDLIILDADIKGIESLDVLEIIRKCRPKIPVIAITSDNSFRTGLKIAKQGVLYYMLKPAAKEEVNQVLESVSEK